MTNEELRALRKRMSLTQKELGHIIAVGLGRGETATAENVGRWERGDRPIPAEIVSFMEIMGEGGEWPTQEGTPLTGETNKGGWKKKEDTEPVMPGTVERGSPLIAVGGSYADICTQLWVIIATGVGMLGAAIGSAALMGDGQIIDKNSRALGEAYGKLAEKNEAFRNMLVASDKQGAYLAVGLVTGTVVAEIWRNHAYTHPVDVEGVLHVVPGTADNTAGTADAYPA